MISLLLLPIHPHLASPLYHTHMYARTRNLPQAHTRTRAHIASSSPLPPAPTHHRHMDVLLRREPYVSDERFHAASFTFQDWCAWH